MNESENERDLQKDKEELAKALPKLTPEQLSNVSPHLTHETYKASETIIRQEETPDRFYILVGGQVEIWHEDLDGDAHLVAKIEPGGYFGETGLLHDDPRTATVRVSPDNEAVVLALDRRYFEEMIKVSKATEAQVAREMIQRLIELSDYQN